MSDQNSNLQCAERLTDGRFLVLLEIILAESEDDGGFPYGRFPCRVVI